MSKMSNKIILGIVILATVAVGIYYFNIKEKQIKIFLIIIKIFKIKFKYFTKDVLF